MLLIAGGATVVISLSALGYYGMRLLETLESEKKSTVGPGESIEITHNFTAPGQGAYLAAFPEFAGGRPAITIRDPADQQVLQKLADPPIVMETFGVVEPGNYTLTLSNPSSDFELEAALVLDTQEAVLGRAGALSPTITAAFGFLLVAGIGAVLSGVVITIMDRRRISRMKQFGDTSDLV